MPLPLFLGAGAAIAGAVGITNGLKGAANAKNASDRIKSAERQHNENIRWFEETNTETTKVMDELGMLELEILNSFTEFSDLIEKIQNRPKFKEITKNDVNLPQYEGEDLERVSVGASVILGGLGGAAIGTAGGYAAAGATTYAVMAFGTASTGTAISSLSGAALTKATLAALGGGALKSSAFAGGMALGSAVLSAATLGVGLLVGGSIFKATGVKLSNQADEAYKQMREAEETINKTCLYLIELDGIARRYSISLKQVQAQYKDYLKQLSAILQEKNDWINFSSKEKLITQNLILLVGLLYKMCQINLVNKKEDEEPTVNDVVVSQCMVDAEKTMDFGYSMTQLLSDQEAVELYEIALNYFEGENGYPQDIPKAFEFYKRSAEKGNIGSMVMVGIMFLTGYGVECNKAEGLLWWNKAISYEDVDILFTLAEYFYYGNAFVEQDLEKAFELYHKASIRGHVDAMCKLASMYIDGVGTSQDYRKALGWAVKAAEKGDSVAMYFAGMLYYNLRDIKKSKEWLTKASNAGEYEEITAEANKELKELFGI